MVCRGTVRVTDVFCVGLLWFLSDGSVHRVLFRSGSISVDQVDISGDGIKLEFHFIPTSEQVFGVVSLSLVRVLCLSVGSLVFISLAALHLPYFTFFSTEVSSPTEATFDFSDTILLSSGSVLGAWSRCTVSLRSQGSSWASVVLVSNNGTSFVLHLASSFSVSSVDLVSALSRGLSAPDRENDRGLVWKYKLGPSMGRDKVSTQRGTHTVRQLVSE